jgi:hypothetical protein
MFWKSKHVSQNELLQFVDGELSAFEMYRARRHLAGCIECRSREREMKLTLARLIRAYRVDLGYRIFGDNFLRTRLKAQLKIAATPENWFRHYVISTPLQASACLCLALLLVTLGTAFLLRQTQKIDLRSKPIVQEAGLLPNGVLTPGATRPIKLADIYPADDDDLDPTVPVSTEETSFGNTV